MDEAMRQSASFWASNHTNPCTLTKVCRSDLSFPAQWDPKLGIHVT